MSQLLESLAAPFDALPLRDAAGLGDRRRRALAAALRDGLPGPRTEAWKYTSLRPLERRRFLATQAGAAVEDAVLADIPAPRLVFVNGHFDAARSDLGAPAAGISIEPLSRMLARGDAQECSAVLPDDDAPDHAFSRLNAALSVEGAVIRAAAGARMDGAIHVVAVATAAGSEGSAWHLRHLVDVEAGARVEVVEHLLAGGDHAGLATVVTRTRLAAGAMLLHARVQDESHGSTLIARTDAVLAADAVYRRLDLELGGGLSRHELGVVLEGERACANANGVMLATGRGHQDTRLAIDHAGRDSRCELTWRGLAAGRSRAAFHGGILIREGADGTEAALSNKNLLLSDAAEIDSQPVLVIHADEVKAAHGATVGQLDPTALFYLRSRGVPKAQARALLTAAFCRETLSVFDAGPTRDFLDRRLEAALVRAQLA